VSIERLSVGDGDGVIIAPDSSGPYVRYDDVALLLSAVRAYLTSLDIAPCASCHPPEGVVASGWCTCDDIAEGKASALQLLRDAWSIVNGD
jgi:hypothetical protein